MAEISVQVIANPEVANANSVFRRAEEEDLCVSIIFLTIIEVKYIYVLWPTARPDVLIKSGHFVVKLVGALIYHTGFISNKASDGKKYPILSKSKVLQTLKHSPKGDNWSHW